MDDSNLLADAIAERAMIYYAIYMELQHRYGHDTATDVLRSAIRTHGRRFGSQLKAQCGEDFAKLVTTFAFSPDNGATFHPKIRHLSENDADVQMMTCPLKQAWLDAGLSPDMTARMLHCASAVDDGTLDEAGIDAKIKTWTPGTDGCCRLRLTKK